MLLGIGFLVGVAVIGLTIYSAVLEKRREYGVLKALGARALAHRRGRRTSAARRRRWLRRRGRAFLELDHTSKVFGDEPLRVRAVDDVTLAVPAGQLVVVMAASGYQVVHLLQDIADFATAADPVCGMQIIIERAAGTRDHHGRTYHFCSRLCVTSSAPTAIATRATSRPLGQHHELRPRPVSHAPLRPAGRAVVDCRLVAGEAAKQQPTQKGRLWLSTR